MIISASRRTDIPAFYAEWFMNRIRAGYCTVPNPFNRNQVSYVSLKPSEIEVIVFWTRNPRPLFAHLAELDQLGYRYYFQFTVMANPRELDPKSPPLAAAVKTFKQLAELVTPARVIWRYDPMVFSNVTNAAFHQTTYSQIAQELQGYTTRSVISIVDDYKKARKRMQDLTRQGINVQTESQFWQSDGEVDALLRNMAEIATAHDMEIVSCAEELDLESCGIRPGKCVDDGVIKQIFGLEVGLKKDPSQREACGCVVSKDIGMYDSCLFGCQYCYATTSFDLAKRNHEAHDPLSPSIVGWYEVEPKTTDKKLNQTRMF